MQFLLKSNIFFFFYKKQYMLNVKKQENESHLWSYNFRIFK